MVEILLAATVGFDFNLNAPKGIMKICRVSFFQLALILTALLLNLSASAQVALESQTVQVGSNVLFVGEPQVPGEYTYQWLFNGNPIQGATDSSLWLTNVQFSNAGSYSVLTNGNLFVFVYPKLSVIRSNALLTVYLPLTIVQTNRAPTTNEIAPPIFHPPPTFAQLKVFTNGIFTTNVVLNSNAMTIILTHGWIPLYPLTSLPIFVPNGVEDWPTAMAMQLHAQGVTANIVAWNWEDTAKSSLADPKRAGSQSPGEGFELGMALFNALGPNYSKPIHFIGHSFGTLVNAYAANYLQGTNFANEAVSSTPWPATNMQMTLFDEAEVGADQDFNLNSEDITLIEALVSGNGNSLNLNMPSSYYHPLPRNFAWADNYVSAFGLLHTNAANVILTDGFPTDAPNPISLLKEIGAFHGYPQEWYDETIETDISSMGFLWSFERGGWLSQAPSEGSVYVQTSNNSPWNLTLTNWNYGTNFLEQRFQKYDAGLGNSTAQFVDNTVTADGATIAQIVWDITTDNPEWLVSLETTVFNSVTPQVKVHPLGLSADDESSSTNIPAYAWMQLIVPTNAVSMSFNYIIQGDWKSDSLAAAFKGTNVLLIAGNTIQTNVTFSSGSIDVSSQFRDKPRHAIEQFHRK